MMWPLTVCRMSGGGFILAGPQLFLGSQLLPVKRALFSTSEVNRPVAPYSLAIRFFLSIRSSWRCGAACQLGQSLPPPDPVNF